jgi:hypothetical protein
MTAQCFSGWAKASGIPLLAVVVSGASVLAVSVFSWWQVRIAREKLRHDFQICRKWQNLSDRAVDYLALAMCTIMKTKVLKTTWQLPCIFIGT